jgi:dipeptidyl aminopeptidase/acylaminoacyl peptidase
MMRSALTPDAAYVDLVQHGDGLVAMQFRRQAGGSTEEIRGPQGVLGILCLERHGSLFSAHLIDSAGRFIPIGSLAIDLPDTLYAGLAVCSHDEDRLETAMLDSVMMQACPAKERIVESTLEILNIATGQRRIVHRAPLQFEAPNWFENKLVVNSKGRLFSIPAEGGEMQQIDTGMADRCNNDHGFSKDGKWLAISHSPNQASLIYVLPAAGGSPRQVTMHGPSYWHGWSPDGRTLVYCAERQGEYDVYAIPFVGGAEKRLTTAIGLDDGPEYSPDGKYIYFNSVRTGVMKIWRMRPDGTHQEQVTFSEPFADWFAHPSPDGKWLAFISYDRAVPGHPANKNVCLRLMPASGGEPRIIAQFFGGQGSFNVPSWSADSRELAFVSYRLIGSAQP